jgi:hypothetical protein
MTHIAGAGGRETFQRGECDVEVLLAPCLRRCRGSRDHCCPRRVWFEFLELELLKLVDLELERRQPKHKQFVGQLRSQYDGFGKLHPDGPDGAAGRS